MASCDSVGGGVVEVVSNDRVEVLPGMLVLSQASANHPLHHLPIFHSEPPYRRELHEAVATIPAKTEPLDHETVGGIGLHVERESKCQKTHNVHSKLLQTVTHIDRRTSLTGFPDMFDKQVDLLQHGWLEISHRLVIDGLSN